MDALSMQGDICAESPAECSGWRESQELLALRMHLSTQELLFPTRGAQMRLGPNLRGLLPRFCP